jgi:hypothetical protein
MIDTVDRENEAGGPVLSADEIECLARHGYARVVEAFPRDAALAMQEFMWQELHELHGIDRHDRATWTHAWPAIGLKRSSTDPIFDAVAAPRLCGAIDQLLGEGHWEVPKSWGGFLITYPPASPSPWELPARGWHWDGDAFHHLDALNGILLFTFFSQVEPRGGGTLAAAGSHRLLERFHRALPPDDRPRHAILLKRFSGSHPWLAELTGITPTTGDRITRFMETTTEIDGIPARVVELTGEPGDAVLCHPSIFHAAAPNRADAPRFMRVKPIRKSSRITRKEAE